MTAPQRITLSELARKTATRGLDAIAKNDEDLAHRLNRMRGTRPDKPTVVVVGEAKRGKSSLTNALINVPNLSPVDARVATSTYIIFRRGAQTAARALMADSDQPIDVPLDRMRDWATDLGNRGQFAPPRLIEVECNSPLLGNLNIVDTPGVGGLDPAHAEIALRAVSRATALLFVCDASAPFTKPELDFLDRASQSVDLVIFALTKTDAYRGWRQVEADNRELLRKHAPRFADAAMLPVSAKLFEQAGLMGGSDLAKALRKESNIITLQITLQQQVAAKAAALHEANLLRTMRSQLSAMQSTLEDSRLACQPDPQYAGRLKENRDRLVKERQTGSKAWQMRLRAQLSRARADTMADIATEGRRAQQYWRTVIEEADKSRLKQLAPYLDAALRASSMRIIDRQQGRLRSVSTSVLQSMFARNELAQVYAALQRPQINSQMAAGPRVKTMTTDEKVVTGVSLMSSITLAKLVTAPLEVGVASALGVGATAAGFIIAPVLIGIGIGAASWLVWAKRTAADRNHLKVWLNETLQETRARLESEATAYFIEAEQQLTMALDRALGRRIETLDGHIREIDNSLKVNQAERQRRSNELTKQINEIKDINATIDVVLPRLRNAVVAAKQPAAVPDRVRALARPAAAAPDRPAFTPVAQPAPAQVAPAPAAQPVAAPVAAPVPVAAPAAVPVAAPAAVPVAAPAAVQGWQSQALPPRT